MQQRVIIQLEDFPEEGRYEEGEADGALFDIDNTGVRSIGPLAYHLHAQLYEDELLLQGKLCASFRVCCGRCLKEFDYEVEADNVAFSINVKGKAYADITEEVREEILLELPSYPKCELAGLECELNDTFGDFRLDKDPQSGVDFFTPSGKSVWDALDQLS